MRKLVFVAVVCGALLGGTAFASADEWTTRKAIETMSPVALAAIERMEADRGVAYDDSALADILASPEFAEKYRVALEAFCAKPESSRVQSCVDDRELGQQGKPSHGSGI